MIWQVTNQCNYRCSYCIFSADFRKPEGELATVHFLRTLDALKARGFTHLKVTGGEPFIRPDMLEILEYAHQLGFETDISSNASMITRRIAEGIAAAKVATVHVSLDGPTKELQERVRGAGTFEPTVRGIRTLVAAGLYVRIGCLIYRGNERRLKAMVEYCAGLGVNEVIFSYMEPVGRLRGDTSLVARRPMKDLIAELTALRSRWAGRIKVSFSFTREAPADSRGTCPGAARFLSIDNLGRVSPCTWVAERQPALVSKMTLREHGLDEILASPELRGYTELAGRLAVSGLGRCPMTAVPEFERARRLDTLFAGSRLDLSGQPKFGPHSQVYPFATENIAAYLPGLAVRGQRVLTVGGSGDHVIGAALAGAKEVVAFDVNELAPLFAELKRAGLLRLTYAGFRGFFLPGGSSAFAHRTYLKLRPELSFAARYFFDRAYEACGRDGRKLRASGLFRTSHESAARDVANNPYLASAAAFDRAKKAVKKTASSWIAADVRELPAKLAGRRGRFDVILLSNIADYAHRFYPDAPYLERFRDEVVKPLLGRLAPGGRLVLAYIYDLDNCRRSDERNRLNDAAERRRVFGRLPGTVYEEKSLPGVIAGCAADGIAVLKRVRK